jgi:hypothetical protein
LIKEYHLAQYDLPKDEQHLFEFDDLSQDPVFMQKMLSQAKKDINYEHKT